MSEFDFAGTVAVVTGGASGIGRALATSLAGQGSRVAVVDLDRAQAERVAAELPTAGAAGAGGAGGAGGTHLGLGADVGDRSQVRGLVDDVEAGLGPIDIYCSNAGIASGAGLGEDDDWDASWRVHGMAHIHAARSVLSGMGERGRGVFVVTASAAGLLMMMQSAPYTVTKHASVSIAEWLAVNFGSDGVQFHCLCPQGVLTPMVTGGEPTATAELRASGNLLEPEEVADQVLEAIRANRFLVLPHPEVRSYEQRKVADRDQWLAGMRRLLHRVSG